ncbi:hypothetical protein CJI97_000608 [Candidozyma auris]|nr:hypothetical protein CJI97_000608 [[Candida] auris]
MWQLLLLAFLVPLAHKDTRLAIQRYINTYYYKYISVSNPGTPASSRKGSYASNEELPKPTPLMITPEQVKNYDDRPWRPFRWPYHQTMSIFKLDINHWLDMDKYYWHYIEEKKRVFMKYGKQNIDWLPGSEDACTELMETVSQHMIDRYPLLFTVLIDKKERGRVIRNELTKEILDMTLPLKEHPLVYVSMMAKEDFYVVRKDPNDGLHHLVAAAVPFPGGSFDISTKIGKHLDVIHEDVPYYKEKLKNSMERWFSRLAPNSPVERASWYISWDHKLKMSNVYQVPEVVPDLEETMKSTPPGSFNVRVERQTLRRLPKSQAIIFTNHPVFYSLDEMKDEPMVPSLIRKILYEGPGDIIKYKNFDFLRDHLVGYLDKVIEDQIDKGLISKDQPVKTLPTYPFASWAQTDFDFVNGWNNPRFDGRKPDYSEQAKKELIYSND